MQSSAGPLDPELLALLSSAAVRGDVGAGALRALPPFVPTEGPQLAAAAAARGRALTASSAVVDATWLYPASATVKLVFVARGSMSMCTGALVTVHHVLTAAHCVMDNAGRFYSNETYYVIPGLGDVMAPFVQDASKRLFMGACGGGGRGSGGVARVYALLGCAAYMHITLCVLTHA